MKIISLSCLSILLLFACKMQKNGTANNQKTLTKADKILAKTITAHGGKKYDQAHYEFVFRKNKYSFKNDGSQYRYTAVKMKDGQKIVDVLDNNNFTRTINGNPTRLSEKQSKGYTGALNSVIYFATLPHKLQDPAVNLSYIGTTQIKGKNYEILEVNFDEEGGGTDHDDEFYYWISTTTNLIDYLAYNYQVNGGGVRFRSAYNTRKVDGIIFQDYVNYKAEVGTSLADLPKLLEVNKLKKLSVIETENVVQVK